MSTIDALVGDELWEDDETTMLWSKLSFLAPFALATTASEGSLGCVRADAGWWASLEQCVNEACAVGVAEGAKVAPEPVLTALEGLPNGFRSSMPSRDPSSVAVASTASRCQRLVPSWNGLWP